MAVPLLSADMLPQKPCRRHFIAELPARLVQWDVRRAAGSESAIRVEGEPPGSDVSERLFHPRGDLLRRVDMRAPAVDAAEPDQPVGGQVPENGEIAGHRNGELQHILLDVQPAKRIQNRPISALADPSFPGLVAPAKM